MDTGALHILPGATWKYFFAICAAYCDDLQAARHLADKLRCLITCFVYFPVAELQQSQICQLIQSQHGFSREMFNSVLFCLSYNQYSMYVH